MKRTLLNRVGLGIAVSFIIGVIAVMFFGVFIGEKVFYDYLEVQPANMVRLDQWMENFQFSLYISVGIGLTGYFFWFLIGVLRYNINNWKRAGGRNVWFLIFAILLASVLVFGFFKLESTLDAGKTLASIYLVITALIVFWIPSLIVSPTEVKYAPLGAARFAPIGNWIVRKLG